VLVIFLVRLFVFFVVCFFLCRCFFFFFFFLGFLSVCTGVITPVCFFGFFLCVFLLFSVWRVFADDILLQLGRYCVSSPFPRL